MTIIFLSLMLVWLLPLTSGQNNTFSHVTTGTQVTPSESTRDQLATREASGLDPVSEVASRHITRSIGVQENGTKPSDEPSPQTPSKMFPPGILTAATPNNSTWSRFNGSTEGVKSTMETLFNFTTSAAIVATSHAGDPTTRAPPTPSSSAQTQSTDDETSRPSTRPTPSTSLVSTTDASTEPVENKTTNASPVPATQFPGLYRTAKAKTKTPSVHDAKTKERRPGGKEKPAKGSNHSKIVAGVIGGALVVMMVGFLFIFIKKRKLQKQQITTGDWAGPSPFLEGGVNNGQVTMRPSNRISLSSFLTQRLSKRLSALPDAGEELEDLTPASTFRGEHKGSSFGREAGGSDGGESNGMAGVVPETKSNGDTPMETSVSLTNETPHTNNNSEVANHIQDLSANPPTPPGLP
ncbi:protein EVI2B-like [Cebidichthys violaceus]|uniref:protein EVI2B-like n=1 Tax=Cebidichthys violaceus TaxID=271503 RepID=UPI0035CAC8F3